MRQNAPLNITQGSLLDVYLVDTAAAVTYYPFLTTTAAPRSASSRFPPWAIVVTVFFILLLCLFGLSYQFNFLCFKLLHRYRQRRAHERRYGTGGFPLPSPEELAAMGRGLCPAPPVLLDSPYADPAADIVVYRRAPLSQGGGHCWVPSFSRMYNRLQPEQSRGLFVALHELRGEVLLHHSTTTASSSGEAQEEEEEEMDGAFTAEEGRDEARRSNSGVFSNATAVSSSLSRPVATAVATQETFRAAPAAVWMTAGTPIRSHLTAYLTDPLHHTTMHPTRTAAALRGGRAPEASPPPHAEESSVPPPHYAAATPAAAEGVATVPNGFRAPTHMFFPLAQYCDLRQWHLVDRPEASLGTVQVISLARLAAEAVVRQCGDDDSGCANGDGAEFDVPSEVLYGAAHYKQKVVSAMPEPRCLAVAEPSSHSASSSPSLTSPVSDAPRVRGNRFCVHVTEDFFSDEASVF